MKKGDDFLFVNDLSVVGDATQVATTYTKDLCQIGDHLVVDDGSVSFVVVERLENAIKTKVQNNGKSFAPRLTIGILCANKGINFPERSIDDLPAISAKDRGIIYISQLRLIITLEDLAFAVTQQVDFVSVSCLRDEEDVQELRFACRVAFLFIVDCSWATLQSRSLQRLKTKRYFLCFEKLVIIRFRE